MEDFSDFMDFDAVSSTYYQCNSCWALTRGDYVDLNDKCLNCGAGLIGCSAKLEPKSLSPVQKVMNATSREQLMSTAYDPEEEHHGCWYIPSLEKLILPTPVALMQSKGPGDALRFLHAARCVLENIRSRAGRNAKMLVFLEESYARHIVGLYSQKDIAPILQYGQLITWVEHIDKLGAIHWIALKGCSFSESMVNLTAYINSMLVYLNTVGYRWYSAGGKKPLILEPYHGKTRYHEFDKVQFARIDLNEEYMEYSYLKIPHRTQGSKVRPMNTVRVLLYVRSQETEPYRNTPRYHFEFLRQCQQSLNVVLQITLAGLKTQDDYKKALNKMASGLFDTVTNQWGWSLYCYADQSYCEQFKYIENGYDVAIGVNTSALDLAAAAGCVVIRDLEWKQQEYAGDFYNLFLLSEATWGIFGEGPNNNERLFKEFLPKILVKPLGLPRKYIKLYRYKDEVHGWRSTVTEIGALK